jgi:cytochrome P450
VTATRVRFNPFAPGFRRDPYPHYRALREAPPRRSLGMWVLTRHADVRGVLRDRAVSAELVPRLVGRHAGALDPARVDQILRLGRASLVFTDNPAHARLRALAGRVFTPSAIACVAPLVARHALQRVASMRAAGGGDVVADLAAPLPVEVLCDWTALPEPVRPHVAGWTRTLRLLLEPGLLTGRSLARVADAVEAFVAVLAPAVERRRAAPGDDLVSALAAARTGAGDRLEDEEVAFLAVMCFVAGTETTAALTSTTVLALLQHPEQSALLRARPELTSAAVREALRFDSPLQMTTRVATRDIAVGDTVISAGEQVLLCLAAANRDPEAFPDPDRFDLTRDTGEHVGFGHGVHGCLGGSIAELTATTAVAALFDAPEPVALRSGPPEWQTASAIVRSLVALPVTTGGGR